MTKKLKIEAAIKEDGIGFTIKKSKNLSLIEILGLLQHFSAEVHKTFEERVKITKA